MLFPSGTENPIVVDEASSFNLVLLRCRVNSFCFSCRGWREKVADEGKGKMERKKKREGEVVIILMGMHI